MKVKKAIIGLPHLGSQQVILVVFIILMLNVHY
ncbi:putative membrane protein, partial [Yersinia pestis PY-58]